MSDKMLMITKSHNNTQSAIGRIETFDIDKFRSFVSERTGATFEESTTQGATYLSYNTETNVITEHVNTIVELPGWIYVTREIKEEVRATYYLVEVGEDLLKNKQMSCARQVIDSIEQKIEQNSSIVQSLQSDIGMMISELCSQGLNEILDWSKTVPYTNKIAGLLGFVCKRLARTQDAIEFYIKAVQNGDTYWFANINLDNLNDMQRISLIVSMAKHDALIETQGSGWSDILNIIGKLENWNALIDIIKQDYLDNDTNGYYHNLIGVIYWYKAKDTKKAIEYCEIAGQRGRLGAKNNVNKMKQQ